jgi:hypothetical protein
MPASRPSTTRKASGRRDPVALAGVVRSSLEVVDGRLAGIALEGSATPATASRAFCTRLTTTCSTRGPSPST